MPSTSNLDLHNGKVVNSATETTALYTSFLHHVVQSKDASQTLLKHMHIKRHMIRNIYGNEQHYAGRTITNIIQSLMTYNVVIMHVKMEGKKI